MSLLIAELANASCFIVSSPVLLKTRLCWARIRSAIQVDVQARLLTDHSAMGPSGGCRAHLTTPTIGCAFRRHQHPMGNLDTLRHIGTRLADLTTSQPSRLQSPVVHQPILPVPAPKLHGVLRAASLPARPPVRQRRNGHA